MKTKLLLLLTAALLCGALPSCTALQQKGNCFGPPTQGTQDAHAQFTAKLLSSP